jgi:hypothetical protein
MYSKRENQQERAKKRLSSDFAYKLTTSDGTMLLKKAN